MWLLLAFLAPILLVTLPLGTVRMFLLGQLIWVRCGAALISLALIPVIGAVSVASYFITTIWGCGLDCAPQQQGNAVVWLACMSVVMVTFVSNLIKTLIQYRQDRRL